MKTKIFAILCGVIFFNCKETPSAPRTAAPLTTLPAAADKQKDVEVLIDFKVRIAIVDKWFTSAQELVDQSGDAEASESFNYALDNKVVGVPGINGIKVLTENYKGGNENTIYVFLVMPSDLGTDPQFSPTGKAFAVYNSENKTLALRNTDKLSPFIKGLMLLHECKHAFDLKALPMADKSQRKIYEKAAYELMARVAKKIKKQAFEEILVAEALRISDELEKMTDETNEKLISAGPYNKNCETVFGPAQSDQEIKLRQWLVFVFGTFKLLEDTYDPATAELQKGNFFELFGE